MMDPELLKAILFGNRRAVYCLYHTYAPPLRRFIQARVGNAQDSEEILQDTLFAFLEGLRDFQEKSSIKTYLYSIGKHKIIDFYRRKKVKHVVFSRFPQIEALISPMLNPEAELDAAMIKEKISGVFGRILPRYSEILHLKYFDNLSVEEIANRFAITFKSAESRLFRARKAFVEAFLSI